MASRTVSTAAEEILARNVSRKSFLIQNEDANISVYIKRERVETPTVSATDHDFLVFGGGSISLNNGLDGDEAIKDRWTIVAASGTPRVSLFETENVIR